MVDFTVIFAAYKKAIIEDPRLNTNVFLDKYEVLDASKETMLNTLNLMLDNEKRVTVNDSNTNNVASSLEPIILETKDDRGKSITVDVDQELISAPDVTPIVNEIVQPIIKAKSYIDMLKDKSNWSELTAKGEEFKIYEIVQENDSVYIIGLVTTEAQGVTPIKWNILGIGPDNTHSIKFKPELKAGDPIIVSNDGTLYSGVFKGYEDDKYLTFDSISDDTNKTWDYAIPWHIYNEAMN